MYCIHSVSYSPSNSFRTTAHAWNIAPKQGGVTASATAEVSRLTAEMIADSDEGSDTDPFSDLDEDEDQTEKDRVSWVQSACAKASVTALELYLPLFSIRV